MDDWRCPGGPSVDSSVMLAVTVSIARETASNPEYTGFWFRRDYSDLHANKFSVSSMKGRGSTVAISLPSLFFTV